MVKTKKLLSEISHQKRNQQNKKSLNPFEVHINKDKQNVLGKRSKTDRGLPGISRAKAINKRKGTLLQEYKLKNKDNLFLDKRIGEKNVAMNEEEKAIARFAAERVKAHKKKSIYNLNDEEILTHRGQTLEEIEKFDDPKSDDEFSEDENTTGKLHDKFVGEAHFGGGILSKSDSQKSRKDIIDELIAESKKRKAEKQKIREQTIDLTEKLDSEWRDLLPIISTANKNIEETVEKTKADDYDIAVRELKYEAKGMPSDKLKSEDEIIKEEKEKLEALESDRLARMKGLVSDSNSEIKHKSADDLDDGFELETVEDETVNDEVNSNKNSEKNSNNEDASDMSDTEDNDNDDDNDNNSDADDSISNNDKEEIGNEESDAVEMNGIVKKETDTENSVESELDENSNVEKFESSEEDNLSDLKESESSSEDETDTEITSKEKLTLKSENDTKILKLNDQTREQEIRDDLLKRKEIMENARKELPYTYKIPESFEELQELLHNRNPDYQSLIVDRIIKCNHWSLDNKNKEKLSNLFLLLLQHLNDCAVEDDVESVIKCFQIIDRLSPFLYDLAHVDPQNTKNVMQAIIKEKHEEFEKNKKRYPSLDTLIFFKLVSLIFPTSDYRHPVTTPCLIFMSQILFRCRIKNKVDVSKGLFICTLILEYTVLSKRFAPSVINFLRGVIYVSTPKHLIQGIKMIPPFKTAGELSNLLILYEDKTDLDIEPNTTSMKASDLTDGEMDDEFKIRALLTAVNLLNEFKNHLEQLDAVYSIFEPVVKLLKPNSYDKYPQSVRKSVKQLRKDLKALKNKKLEYIVLEKKKPKPLRLYEPRIEAVYDGKKHRTTSSKVKAEREKLLHKYKKEMKGAMREIRRDRAFLAKLQIKEQIKNDEERKRKVREIFGDAAMQQNELKKLKRKK